MPGSGANSPYYRQLNKLDHSFTLINYTEEFPSFPRSCYSLKSRHLSSRQLCYFKPHLATPHQNKARTSYP
jgi:hypothetical protein